MYYSSTFKQLYVAQLSNMGESFHFSHRSFHIMKIPLSFQPQWWTPRQTPVESLWYEWCSRWLAPWRTSQSRDDYVHIFHIVIATSRSLYILNIETQKWHDFLNKESKPFENSTIFLFIFHLYAKHTNRQSEANTWFCLS